MNSPQIAVVIPNLNGADSLKKCLDSLVEQSHSCQIIVVDNASSDGSAELVEASYPQAWLIRNTRNLGFTGGVNPGIKRAMDEGFEYVALLNNDAVAQPDWLKQLVSRLEANSKLGIVTSKICDSQKKHLDSTGDLYTIWGLPFPRGRGEPVSDKYDEATEVFAASGGASLYRTKMLEQIGLFDDDFFAYYEDVDLSFRAQLAGWKVGYEPKAVVYHEIGATSGKMSGFTTYQTLKNLPQLVVKNVPGRLYFKVQPRFEIVYWSFFASAVARGQGWPALKGYLMAVLMTPKKLVQRYRIQRKRKVPIDYIDSILTHDLPPNAHKLRALRARWWKFTGRQK